MSVEKRGYRDQIARLNEVFPNKDVLTVGEVAKYTGKDRKTIRKYLCPTPLGISKVMLARFLVG